MTKLSSPQTHDEVLEAKMASMPHFSCVCELCDCGRHLHHQGCVKGQGKNKKVPAPIALTHNQDVYRAHHNTRPRSSKRPAPLAPQDSPTAGLPMTFQTQQRSEFIVRPLPEKAVADVRKENIEIPSGKIQGVTSYSQEFQAKPIEPLKANVAKDRYSMATSAKFESRTTNLDMFKAWEPQKNTKFSELPCLTGSIMFPDTKDTAPTLSTTAQSYIGKALPKPQPAKAAPNNLLIEGAHDMVTTNQQVYKGADGERAVTMRACPSGPKTLGRFMGQSQTHLDFQSQVGSERAKPILQPKETIDLSFDNRRCFETEQRALFKGHDARSHPVVASCKRVPTPYTRPSVPIEGQTTTHIHFPPQEMVGDAKGGRVKGPLGSLGYNGNASEAPHFDGRTMNKEQFQRWEVRPRERHGDKYESRVYVAPNQPFEAYSTTKTTFVEKPLTMTHSFRPKEEGLGAREKGGQYTTVHRDTYKGHEVKPCLAQVYLLHQQRSSRPVGSKQALHTIQ